MHKCGFKSVVLGLSGGIDSALTAALAVAALGQGQSRRRRHAQPIQLRHIPSTTPANWPTTSASNFTIIPIKTVCTRAYETTLAPAFAGLAADVTEENIQARIRGALLMAFQQ